MLGLESRSKLVEMSLALVNGFQTFASLSQVFGGTWEV